MENVNSFDSSWRKRDFATALYDIKRGMHGNSAMDAPEALIVVQLPDVLMLRTSRSKMPFPAKIKIWCSMG